MHESRAARVFSQHIIGRVSRTFAIGIRLLPGKLGRAVLTGYLLCRIADTIEDDAATPAPRRQELLARFRACFDDPSIAAGFAAEAAEIRGNRDHLELVHGTKLVFDLFRELPSESAAIVAQWAQEMARGMSEFVGENPSGIRIRTMAQYRRYCYFVAGTVGHLLTDLWHVHSRLVPDRVYQRLLEHCEAFGEALQTVNILKDIPWDIEHENAAYVPEDLLLAQGSSHQTLLQRDHVGQNRAALGDLVELAKLDLRRSRDYVCAIPRRAVAIRLFCLLPILFAVATLREIEQSTAMLESGGFVKISRREVRMLIAAGALATVSNRATRWLIERTSHAPLGLRLRPAALT